MTWRTPLDYFCYDKIDKININVQASVNVQARMLKKMPHGAISWTLRNTGPYPIFYALENGTKKNFTYFETLDPDVTIVQDTIPRYIYYANVERVPGNDTSLYFEVTVPEDEDDRLKGEESAFHQLRVTLGILANMFPRLFSRR